MEWQSPFRSGFRKLCWRNMLPNGEQSFNCAEKDLYNEWTLALTCAGDLDQGFWSSPSARHYLGMESPQSLPDWISPSFIPNVIHLPLNFVGSLAKIRSIRCLCGVNQAERRCKAIPRRGCEGPGHVRSQGSKARSRVIRVKVRKKGVMFRRRLRTWPRRCVTRDSLFFLYWNVQHIPRMY